jgi:hypothetical protein
MRDEVLESIRTILFEIWDPIGINDNEKLSDEYDSYALQLYKLACDKNRKAILEFLRRVELDLQLPTDPERTERVVRRIIEAPGSSAACR